MSGLSHSGKESVELQYRTVPDGLQHTVCDMPSDRGQLFPLHVALGPARAVVPSRSTLVVAYWHTGSRTLYLHEPAPSPQHPGSFVFCIFYFYIYTFLTLVRHGGGFLCARRTNKGCTTRTRFLCY